MAGAASSNPLRNWLDVSPGSATVPPRNPRASMVKGTWPGLACRRCPRPASGSAAMVSSIGRVRMGAPASTR